MLSWTVLKLKLSWYKRFSHLSDDVLHHFIPSYNAIGNVLHNLIQFALNQKNDLQGLWWDLYPCEGCPLSCILFLDVFNYNQNIMTKIKIKFIFVEKYALLSHVSTLFLLVWSKEFKRGNPVSFWPLCYCYGVAAMLTVTYGGELLYFWIWRDLRTLSLPCDSPRDNLYACVI